MRWTAAARTALTLVAGVAIGLAANTSADADAGLVGPDLAPRAAIAPAAAYDDAQARPAKRSTRSSKRAKKRTTAKPSDRRPDRGFVGDRKPALAKVATGDRLRADDRLKGRIDASRLPLEEQVARDIEALLRGPLRDGTTSLFVADATTGAPLFSVYPDDPLNPASNVKLISTAAALDILGPDYRYVTRVLGTTPDAAGVIDGDLYLLGTYDPTLSRPGIVELASQLRDAGVRELRGDVVVGSTATRDGIYRSLVELEIDAGPPGQAPQVTVSPATDLVVVDVKATTSKKKWTRGLRLETEYVTDDTGRIRLHVTVHGTVGRSARIRRDVWLKERALHAAHLLRLALTEAGIAVHGDVHVAELRDYLDASLTHGFVPVPVAEHRSQPLEQIVARINKRSTNWLADRVIMTAAARKYGGKPSMDKAIDAMYAWLEKDTGLTRDDLVVDTGSGLSYKTELSARQVVEVLRAGLGLEPATAARDAATHDAFRTSLAVGGVDGTIRGRFKSTNGVLLAKTGTLARVISLSGLLEVDPARRVVFSIISNGHHPKWKSRVRHAHEKLVNLLCGYLHALPDPSGETLEAAAADSLETHAAQAAAAAAADPTLVADEADEVADDEAGISETIDR